MKKILFVINTLGRAGAEKSLLELMRQLKNEPVEVYLYVLLNQGELRDEIPDFVHVINREINPTEIHSVEGRRLLLRYAAKILCSPRVIVQNLGYWLKHVGKLFGSNAIGTEKLIWRAMADGAMRINEQFDLAVAYLEGGATYYVDRYVSAGKKVCFLHIDYSLAGYDRALDENCYQNFDRIYSVSDEVKNSFLKEYPELENRTEIFPNILNVRRICELAHETEGFPKKDQGLKILTVGRLDKQKCLEISIAAMELLKRRGLKVHWYVLGEGRMRGFLEREISRRRLREEFILLGSSPNPYPYLLQCDLYVHASFFEGKSIAVQEAQILGKPVLVSDCSGNREQVISGLDGEICAFSPAAIADAIERMLNNPKYLQQLGQNARNKIVPECTKIENLKRMLSLMEK